MAVVEISIPAATRDKIGRDLRLAGRAKEIFGSALLTAAEVGAGRLQEFLVMGELGLTMRHPGQGGMAGSIMAWRIDETTTAFGIPAESPAAKYGGFLDDGGPTGGHIYPKTAKMLAVPVSDEARMHTSPRDMPGLVLIAREGKPPVLARTVGQSLDVHWVLLPHVYIEPRHWRSKGAERAKPDVVEAFRGAVEQWIGDW